MKGIHVASISRVPKHLLSICIDFCTVYWEGGGSFMCQEKLWERDMKFEFFHEWFGRFRAVRISRLLDEVDEDSCM